MSIFDYWPVDYEPRLIQISALQWLEKKKNVKYLFLEAPVGAGKSLIGLTYSAYLANHNTLADGEDTYEDDIPFNNKLLGSSYILTPQKILQAQYENEKNNLDPDVANKTIGSFYGKSNYFCAAKDCNCETGSIVGRCNPCQYKTAKANGIAAANTVLNYKLGLASFSYTDSYTRRQLMILDECHNAEDFLTEFDIITITEQRCIKYNMKWIRHNDITSAYNWIIKTYAPEFRQIYEDWYDDRDSEIIACGRPGAKLTKSQMRMLTEFKQLKEHSEVLDTICQKTIEEVKSHFVLTSEPHKIAFKRLKAGYSFKNILNRQANKFLFMSSTILDYKEFCADLDIDPKEAAFLSLKSEFPVENRPIHYIPQMKVNKDWQGNGAGLGRLKLKTIELMNKYPEDKGIIHTGNFALAQWIVAKLEDSDKIPHRIFHHNPDCDLSRDKVIAEFQEYEGPAVLISPSITEGLDLKNEKGRFAIILKVPFPHLGDAWIKARFEMSNSWYQRKALTGIIQGGGRVVRSADDWGHTYILDGSWGYLSYKAKHMIPQWWRDSVQ